jgi:hypothetical protein
MILFLLLLISGEGFGGFYLVYFLLGLSHGVPHAIIALLALLTMFSGYRIPGRYGAVLKALLFILGNALMIAALIRFFTQSKGYNNSTFHQTLPLISFGLFGVAMLCNLVLAIWLLGRRAGKDDNGLNIVSQS